MKLHYLLLLFLAGCASQPETTNQLEGVRTAPATAPADAYNRLKQGIRLSSLPDGTRTVGGAVSWLLEPTGYTLAEETPLTRRPLSPLAKRIEAQTVEAAILSVIGSSNRLVVEITRQGGRVDIERIPANEVRNSRVVYRLLGN